MNTRQLLVLASIMAWNASFAQTDTGTDAETDGPVGTATIGLQVQRKFVAADYHGLDLMFDSLADPERRLDDGRWPLMGIVPGLSSFFDAYKEWDSMGKKIERWQLVKPESAGAAITEAIYWIAYAWDARGDGTARTVTPEGWSRFRERIERAKQALDDSKSYASSNPLWYDQYLQIAQAQSWSLEEYGALFGEAVSKQPYFYAHYFSMTDYLMPRWHGSFEQIEAFAKASVESTHEVEGHSLYARIYWYLSQRQPLGFDVFKDSYVSWDTMRQGFEDLMDRYPDSKWNLNNFASFACRADDKKTYQKLRESFDQKIFHMAWPSNYSLEICDARLLASDEL